jgi:hypothetical protein
LAVANGHIASPNCESRDARDPPAADAVRVDFDDDGVLYVGRNAEAAAEVFWDAAGNISGNKGGFAPVPNAQEKHASGHEDVTCVRAAGETRTPDLGITNASLYQLSYSG